MPGLSALPGGALLTSQRAASEQTLFRQGHLGLHAEVPANAWRSRIGLAAADADGVFPCGNQRIACLGDHAQIAVLQLEVNFLACARFEMNALEATEGDFGRALDDREL
jgi:hypothetical protein